MLRVSRLLKADLTSDPGIRTFLRAPARAKAFKALIEVCQQELAKDPNFSFPYSWFASNLNEPDRVKKFIKLRTIPGLEEAVKLGLFSLGPHNGFYQTYKVTPKGFELYQELVTAESGDSLSGPQEAHV